MAETGNNLLEDNYLLVGDNDLLREDNNSLQQDSLTKEVQKEGYSDGGGVFQQGGDGDIEDADAGDMTNYVDTLHNLKAQF